jgi:hypothetical protein
VSMKKFSAAHESDLDICCAVARPSRGARTVATPPNPPPSTTMRMVPPEGPATADHLRIRVIVM